MKLVGSTVKALTVSEKTTARIMPTPFGAFRRSKL